MQLDYVMVARSGENCLDLERSSKVLVIELETIVDSGLPVMNSERRYFVIKNESDGITRGVDSIESKSLLHGVRLLGDANTRRINRAIGNITELAGT